MSHSNKIQQRMTIRALEIALEEFPSLRIGQLIENVSWSDETSSKADLFVITDEDLERKLVEYVNKFSNRYKRSQEPR